MIQKFPEASGCPKCKAAFSLVEGGTVIPAHAGPTNTRLRAHLGLVVPKKGDVHMRIANKTVTWKPGKVGRQHNTAQHWHSNCVGVAFFVVVLVWSSNISPE